MGPFVINSILMNKDPILDTPLRIYTAVWGDKYIDLFEKTIIRSFNWQQNKKALLNEKVTWSFHTNKKDCAKLIQLGKRIGLEDFDVTELPEELDGGHPDMGKILLGQFTKEIQRCLETNSRLLLAPPDSIFGDGTIRAILSAGAQEGTCVAVPHPRVLPAIFDYPSEFCHTLNLNLSNSQLVTTAFQNLHRSWSEAQVGFDKINSHVGGVCWRKISPGLFSVQHRLPTNYLIHFVPSDLQFFQQQICFGSIDHLWPTKLVKEERERVIGSSDLAFICEVTDPKQNIPPNYPYLKKEPDRFWRQAPHNAVFRQFSVIFRGVEA